MNSAARNKYFSFLRRLRANGRSNMYGAVPYLMRAFSLDRETAFRVVCEWLDLQAAEAPPPAPRVEARVQRVPRQRIQRRSAARPAKVRRSRKAA